MVLAVLGPAAPAAAGSAGAQEQTRDVVHPQVRAALDAAEADESVEVLVVLHATPDLEAEVGLQAFASRIDAVVRTLRRTAAPAQSQVERTVEQRGDRVLNTFWLHNMVLVSARADTVLALGRLPGVEQVIPNFEIRAPEPAVAAGTPDDFVGDHTWGLARIDADRVHGELGIDGSDVRVATLDTGVAVDHPDLAGKMATDDPDDPTYPGGWIEFDRTGQPVASEPRDTGTHGTHVAGTIHGGDASGWQIGVAPGAGMMHALVLPNGFGTFAQVIAGMQWAMAPTNSTGEPAGAPAHVVNMAFGVVGFADAFVEPTRALRAAGIVPVFPIGNDCDPVGTVSPGNAFDAVSVGATDHDDAVPDFSCGAVVRRDQWEQPPPDWPSAWVKPELSAPGVDVWSAHPDGTHARGTGTSTATPHVAGTVALLLDAAPDLDVDTLLKVLLDTASWDNRYATRPPDTRFGYGRLDAYEAVRAVALEQGIEGDVRDAVTDTPVAGALVTTTETGVVARTDEDGFYRMPLAPGGYDLEVAAFGYGTATVAGVEVEPDRFTRQDVRVAPSATGTVAGTVDFAATGIGVPGARVEVVDTPGDWTAVTERDGAYAIAGLPTGTYRLTASAPGFIDAEGVSVTVPPNGEVTAHLSLRAPRRDVVAVMGDHAGQLATVLDRHGIEADVYD